MNTGHNVTLAQAVIDVKRREAAIRASDRGAAIRATDVASSSNAVCIANATIFSLANNLYVSAELGYGGGDYAMLRARASAIGPWERFAE
jgi:hypothetical protein